MHDFCSPLLPALLSCSVGAVAAAPRRVPRSGYRLPHAADSPTGAAPASPTGAAPRLAAPRLLTHGSRRRSPGRRPGMAPHRAGPEARGPIRAFPAYAPRRTDAQRNRAGAGPGVRCLPRRRAGLVCDVRHVRPRRPPGTHAGLVSTLAGVCDRVLLPVPGRRRVNLAVKGFRLVPRPTYREDSDSCARPPASGGHRGKGRTPRTRPSVSDRASPQRPSIRARRAGGRGRNC